MWRHDLQIYEIKLARLKNASAAKTFLEKKKKSYDIHDVNIFEPQTYFRSCFQKSSSSNHDPSGKEINLVCLSRPPQSVAINISNHFDLQSIDQIRQDVENTIMEQVFI